MGKYTGMSFEKAFGMEKISFDSSRSKSPKRDNAKQYLARGRNIQDMTRNQKDFCSYLSLDTYKDAHGNMRRELIALLIQKDGLKSMILSIVLIFCMGQILLIELLFILL
jgi:hypothetical protein